MTAVLEPLLAPVAEACGVELYNIEYVKEGGIRILRLFIDKEGGVDLNDCERVSRAAEAVLDERDPIPGAYRLQVGSPGVERRLVKPEHFKRYIGHKVGLKLFAPHDGRKKFTGILADFKDEKIHLTEDDGQSRTFDKAQVAACRLVVF